ALRLGRRAIDFVGEHELREHGSLVKAERVRLAIEHRHADDVGGQEVARELNALVGHAERFGKRVRKRRFADARNVLDEEVSAREQARDAQPHLMLLAENHPIELLDRAADELDWVRLSDEGGYG